MLPGSARRRVLSVVATLAVVLAGCGRGDSQAPAAPTPLRATDPSVVQTTTGAVRGLVASDHRLFSGIPYAAPPVGPLRWQPPAPAQPWPGIRDATKPGPQCVQDSSHPADFGRSVSEDCLTLNVWTPNQPPSPSNNAGRPVMVWIHGGAFINGGGDLYDSRWLTSQGGIVVVTINYRLGALGFLAHPSLARNGEAGNYGFADQQAALRWVRDNIANFGGDPGKVTIAGESAGAMSVCDHLVSPGSVGLFRAAIIQSGPCEAQSDRITAQRVSIDYAAARGCSDIETAGDCLRALPATELTEPPWYYHIGSDSLTGPITGTEELPIDPMTAFADGRAARVPVLIGTNADEFTLFVGLQYLRTGRAPAYPEVLTDTFGAQGAQVAEHYPPDHFGGNASLAYAAAVTDGVFACPADRMADSFAGEAPVFAYEFNDRGAPAPDPLRKLPFPVGAAHSLELRYLFDTGGPSQLDPAQRKLSDEMVGYWSEFVTTGVPRVLGIADWPPVRDPATGPRMSFQPDGLQTIKTFDDAHQCPFWAALASK